MKHIVEPQFIYLAYGAPHTPHAAPNNIVDDMRAAYNGSSDIGSK